MQFRSAVLNRFLSQPYTLVSLAQGHLGSLGITAVTVAIQTTLLLYIIYSAHLVAPYRFIIFNKLIIIIVGNGGNDSFHFSKNAGKQISRGTSTIPHRAAVGKR